MNKFTSMPELLILISSQFKWAGIGMENIDSEKPDLITARLVEMCNLSSISLIYIWAIYKASQI